jgi:hypothetical protein
MSKATLFTAVLIATLTLMATDAMAADGVYRWVDENGDVHYGDNPPRQANAEAVDIQSDASSGLKPDAYSQPESSAGQPSQAQQQRDERALQRKQQTEKETSLAAGCEQRRASLAQLEPKTRVMVTTEDGDVYRMDDNDRLAELEKLKTFISENCQD